MPLVALVGYAVFLALAFGLRAILHYRRTGTTGFIGLGGRPGSIEWCAGLLFTVALLGGVAAPVAQLLGWIEPWDGGRFGALHAVGALVAAGGIGGTLWAQLAMGDSWRIGVDTGARTDLVVASGPFRWVRNPIFSWMTLASAGLVLLSPNALAVVALVALLVALEIQVRAVEEPYLLRMHGDAYRRYAASTGRFVPGIGRLEV